MEDSLISADLLVEPVDEVRDEIEEFSLLKDGKTVDSSSVEVDPIALWLDALRKNFELRTITTDDSVETVGLEIYEVDD